MQRPAAPMNGQVAQRRLSGTATIMAASVVAGILAPMWSPWAGSPRPTSRWGGGAARSFRVRTGSPAGASPCRGPRGKSTHRTCPRTGRSRSVGAWPHPVTGGPRGVRPSRPLPAVRTGPVAGAPRGSDRDPPALRQRCRTRPAEPGLLNIERLAQALAVDLPTLMARTEKARCLPRSVNRLVCRGSRPARARPSGTRGLGPP